MGFHVPHDNSLHPHCGEFPTNPAYTTDISAHGLWVPAQEYEVRIPTNRENDLVGIFGPKLVEDGVRMSIEFPNPTGGSYVTFTANADQQAEILAQFPQLRGDIMALAGRKLKVRAEIRQGQHSRIELLELLR